MLLELLVNGIIGKNVKILKTCAVVKRKPETIQSCQDSIPDLCNAATAL